MLEFFPANYVWNLSANLALCMGAPAGEVDGVCRALRDVSRQGDDAGTAAFFDEWCALADRLAQLAEEDLARVESQLAAMQDEPRPEPDSLESERVELTIEAVRGYQPNLGSREGAVTVTVEPFDSSDPTRQPPSSTPSL